MQPVETATDNRHTYLDLGLVVVNVYGFVFHESSYVHSFSGLDKHGHVLSPLMKLCTRFLCSLNLQALSCIPQSSA